MYWIVERPLAFHRLRWKVWNAIDTPGLAALLPRKIPAKALASSQATTAVMPQVDQLMTEVSADGGFQHLHSVVARGQLHSLPGARHHPLQSPNFLSTDHVHATTIRYPSDEGLCFHLTHFKSPGGLPLGFPRFPYLMEVPCETHSDDVGR